MNHTWTRVVCLLLVLAIGVGFAGCGGENNAIVEGMLESIAENEKIQAWLAENDIETLGQNAINKFKESIPVLQEFLAREDVKEKFETVGLPLIKEYLNYKMDSWRLKAETLGSIIRIFAPELTAQVDAIFETAPNPTDNT